MHEGCLGCQVRHGKGAPTPEPKSTELPTYYQSLTVVSFYKKETREKKIPRGKWCSHKNVVAFFSVTLHLKLGTAGFKTLSSHMKTSAALTSPTPRKQLPYIFRNY